MTAADDVDVDVADVRVIGLCRGNKRPKFTYDNASGEFVIGAVNVRIENLWFVPSVTAVTHAVDVEATFSGVEIVNCEFSGAEAIDIPVKENLVPEVYFPFKGNIDLKKSFSADDANK